MYGKDELLRMAAEKNTMLAMQQHSVDTTQSILKQRESRINTIRCRSCVFSDASSVCVA